MLKTPRYVIAVPDLAATSRYMHEVLGFDVREVGDAGWRMYVRDACTILAGDCPDAMEASHTGDHSYFAYVVVDDVDDVESLHREWTERGAELIKPLRAEPWGMREFGIRLPDGHRMMLGEPTIP